jgi:hypothetical protein
VLDSRCCVVLRLKGQNEIGPAARQRSGPGHERLGLMSVAQATPSTAAKPSPRQVYFIARLALRFAGHELPDTKAGAHELIQTLQSALETQNGGNDDCPF